MLNNLTNFFNLIKSGMTKTQLESSDLLPIGTRDGRYGGNYKPATIKYSDLVAGLVGGSNGQVLFNDSGTIAGASNLYWDKINQRVGIGTSTPTFALDALAPQFGGFRFMASDSTFLRLDTTTTNFQISQSNTQTSLTTSHFGPLYFINNGGAQTRLSLFANGNFAIGTTTDAGFLLDVNGTARVQGDTTVTGSVLATNFNYGNGQGNTKSFPTQGVLAGTKITFNDANPYVGTGNIIHFLLNNSSFAPTSGSGTFTGLNIAYTINQTGGANGITRGLYVNPTLTAAADFRAIETTAGNVLFGSNFFWDNTNSNLGVGIGSPAARLDVITSANKYALRLGENTANGDGSWTGIKFQLSTNTSNLDTQNGTMNIVAYRYSAGSQLSILNSTTTIATFGSASNSLLIGTTTDAGYKLDVNGTARVSSTTTTGLTITQGASGDAIVIQNGGYIQMASTRFRAFATTFQFQDSSFNTKVVLGMTGFSYFNSGANYTFGSTTDVASALVNVDSTTKGFLPPRMTTTQKTAISTPAAGLMVYDTDLNRPCFYNGSSWITL